MINNKNKLLFCSLDNALLGMYYIICILCIYYYLSLSIFDILLDVLNQIENYILLEFVLGNLIFTVHAPAKLCYGFL